MQFEKFVYIFESIKADSFLQLKYTGTLHVLVSYEQIFVILVHTSKGKNTFSAWLLKCILKR